MAEPTVAELTKQLVDIQAQVQSGQTALNITWTLLTGFMVMFMQAGFALVETGLTRAKNVAHTMGMNFLVYAIGIIGFWAIGFGLQMGGVGALATFGNDATLSSEFAVTIAGKDFGLWGTQGFFLTPAVYTSPIAALFLFQMVFMDTTATIPTGAMAERWRFSSFVIFSFVIATITYPIYANWVWGGGWLSQLGTTSGLATATSISRAARSSTWSAASPRWSGPDAGAAHRQVRRATARRCRSRATTSRWPCSARSSSRSAGSASTRARRCRGWTRARRSSPSTRCWRRRAAPSAPTCG